MRPGGGGKPPFLSRSGEELYRLLPELYRTRDGGGTGQDLASFLDACGELLDRFRATLEQRLADAFPAVEPGRRGEPGAQPWLLPYLGRLVGARLVSPHAQGRPTR